MTDNHKALKDARFKATLPRLKILEILQKPNTIMLVRKIYIKLIDIGGEMSLATIYRVLNQFDEADIVCSTQI